MLQHDVADCPLDADNDYEVRKLRGRLGSFDAHSLSQVKPLESSTTRQCREPSHWQCAVVQLEALSDSRSNLSHWLHRIVWSDVRQQVRSQVPALLSNSAAYPRIDVLRDAAHRLRTACECVDWRKKSHDTTLHLLFAEPLHTRTEMLYVLYVARQFIVKAASASLLAASGSRAKQRAPPILWLLTTEDNVLEMTCDGIYSPLELQCDLDVGFLAPYAIDQMRILPQCLHQTFAEFKKSSKGTCALLPDVCGRLVADVDRKRKRSG